jgi:hypothetical protein
MRGIFSAIAALIASLTMLPAANATTVATIDCLGNLDTPVLVINNTTGGTLNNAQMVLTGYNGLNNGKTATVPLGKLGAINDFSVGKSSRRRSVLRLHSGRTNRL